MLFNSLTFLAFFAVVLFLHRLPLPWGAKKLNLLLASYLFYAAWNPPFVVLLWISTLTDWFVARRLAAAERTFSRRVLLLASLAVNLGLLGYFKYAGFFLENFVWLMRGLGIDYQPAASNIILPLGISFYTFQTLSYTIAIYRREAAPCGSFLDYCLFVAFFPQLVAGPIVRAGQFLPQCVTPKSASAEQLGWGVYLLAIGLFEKVILADSLLAPTADLVYRAPSHAGFTDAWIGTLAFSGQIFFDFAGYSSCAIGVALCLGFIIPENFRCPYSAVGFRDFWRRWHISLSTWLRDHLYIPLGGNRRGPSRTQVNLMITMLLGGLWHGASWSFVVWGALHGSYLMIERFLRGRRSGPPEPRSDLARFFISAWTFLVVSVTWVFFRAENLGDALHLLGAMLGATSGRLVEPSACVVVALVIVVTFAVQTLLRDDDLERRIGGLPLPLRSVGLALLLLSLFVAPAYDRAFIYFQF